MYVEASLLVASHMALAYTDMYVLATDGLVIRLHLD